MMRGHETAVHLTQSNNQFTIAFVFDGQAMNTSEFVLDGQTHSGPLGATQQARWTNGFRSIEITIHRPVDGPMPGSPNTYSGNWNQRADHPADQHQS